MIKHFSYPNTFIIGCSLFIMFCSWSCSDLGTNSDDDEDNDTTNVISYTVDIQPIFNSYCIVCHGTWGGLNLTTYSYLMNGGDNGIVVIPGNSEESNLVLKLGTTPPFGEQMPLQNPPLSDIQIDLIKNWINDGAKNN